MTCRWWTRGLHRRRRLADRRFMLPLLVGAPGRTNTQRAVALVAFLEAPGQEHWQCACGVQDAADALTAAFFPEGQEP